MFEIKKYNDLDFTDDFMFCKVLTEHPEICRKLAELITGRKIRKLGTVKGQLTIKMLRNGKGVRFDVEFDDDKNTMYDFEMQTTLKKNIPKRMRYYQSIRDAQILKQGSDYTKLPDSYIVFICLEDPFADELRRYTFRTICEENKGLVLQDGAVKIFINANGSRNSGNTQDKELEPFLRYLRMRDATDELTKEIDAAVVSARDDEEGRMMYVTLEEHYAEQREAGRAEGREEGRAEGKAEGRAEGKAEGKAEEREENLKTLSDNLFSSGICGTRSEADTKARDLLKKRG